MSATLNADLFSSYFEGAPTIHIPVSFCSVLSSSFPTILFLHNKQNKYKGRKKYYNCRAYNVEPCWQTEDIRMVLANGACNNCRASHTL